MVRLVRHLQTTVGKKVVVALTGLGLVCFVALHMLGNLQVFEGPHAINRYAAFLRDMPILLWTIRVGLLMLAILHIGLAIQLSVRNHHARPTAYANRTYRHASIASRTMAVSGLVLLAFIVFHLLHLTAGMIAPLLPDHLDTEGHTDVYGKLLHAFRNPIMVSIYLMGQLGLAFHLSHAISSSVQTLGLEHGVFNRLFKVAGPALVFVVVLGNVAIVLAIFLGVVRG